MTEAQLAALRAEQERHPDYQAVCRRLTAVEQANARLHAAVADLTRRLAALEAAQERSDLRASYAARYTPYAQDRPA